jgi:hypothetical protein
MEESGSVSIPNQDISSCSIVSAEIRENESAKADIFQRRV